MRFRNFISKTLYKITLYFRRKQLVQCIQQLRRVSAIYFEQYSARMETPNLSKTEYEKIQKLLKVSKNADEKRALLSEDLEKLSTRNTPIFREWKLLLAAYLQTSYEQDCANLVVYNE